MRFIMSTPSVAFGIATLMEIGWVTGMGIWAQNNSFSYTGSTFGFGWFVSTASLLLTLVGMFAYSRPPHDSKHANISWAIISFVFAIFSVASASAITTSAAGCDIVSQWGSPWDTMCAGMTVAITFGFTTFAMWSVLFGYFVLAVLKNEEVGVSHESLDAVVVDMPAPIVETPAQVVDEMPAPAV
jgi:hypothetical protein